MTHRDKTGERKVDKTLNEIEKNQVLLRESIEATRRLSDQSDFLLKKHRQELSDEA